MRYSFVKRFLDFIGSAISLLILSPALIVIIIWLHMANRGAGAFFCQERPGKNEKIFKLYKFKSMTDEKDHNGELLPDAERLTKVGSFLRKTSIDELPQLWNVLKGDMSFIGPRPLMVRYLPLYTEEQRLRHKVRPGITGWAQVNGRNDLSWARKFDYDVFYVNNMSLSFDLKIFFLTIKKIITREGVVKEGWTTTEPFNGKN